MRAKTIGLIAHPKKKGVAELIGAVTKEFEAAGLSILQEKETAALVGGKSALGVGELAAKCDLLVVLGGDGTILNVAGQLGDNIKPIFGINVGSLGFLTCASSSDHREAVRAIVEGKITLSERTLLEVRVSGGPSMIGLNDAVLSRGEISRLIRLRASVDGEALTEFNADGLVVATPTGSTAYSLSAGGPIMTPDSGVFVITPICPHVLTNRSIIVGENSRIEIEATERDYPIFLTVDGRAPLRVEHGAVVSIRKATTRLPLGTLPGLPFFSIVRQKLKWSGSNI
jgi:NAD+ kinase